MAVSLELERMDTMTATTPAATANTAATASHAEGLGDESSIWFKLSPLLKSDDNPMAVLMRMSQKYGGAISINMGNQRILLLSEPDNFKHVLVSNANNYEKYFDGLRPVFGKSMITHDGALWQKIRMPQQPAFHPAMFDDYVPYFVQAINEKMARWEKLAESGEEFEMVEQTWTLAADMICKALFDRDMPFNPHFIFKCVKTYTDVTNHKSIRLKKNADDDFEVTDASAAKAMETWWEVPDLVLNAEPREHRDSAHPHARTHTSPRPRRLVRASEPRNGRRRALLLRLLFFSLCRRRHAVPPRAAGQRSGSKHSAAALVAPIDPRMASRRRRQVPVRPARRDVRCFRNDTEALRGVHTWNECCC